MRKDYWKAGCMLVANNPKTTFFSVLGSGALLLLRYRFYKKRKKVDTAADLVKTIQEDEIARRTKERETESEILKTAAKTAIKMMEQATSVAPDMKEIKENLKATAEELRAVKEELKATKEGFTQVNPPMAEENPAPRTSGNEFKGRSSADLFKRSYATTGKWIVDKYMKAGLLNLVVAGASKGKSIVLTDIARAVDKGVRPAFLPDTCCASVKLKVIYYRLENFADELPGKYGEGKVLKESGIEWFLPEHLQEKSLDAFIDHLKGVVGTLTEDTAIFVDPATKLSGYKHENFIMGVEKAMEAAQKRNITLSVVASIHHDEISDWTALTAEAIKGGDKGIQQAGSVTALRNERTGYEYRLLQCLKEPKGSGTPFNGQVLVCKIVSENIDENNINTYLQYVDVKPEVEARPMKPKVQSANTGTSAAVTTVTPSVGTFPITASDPSVAATPKAAPNQKVTPEMEKRMKEMVEKGMKASKIAKKTKLSEKTVRRYMREWDNQAA
ncbi:MAG: helix-turn-helix domain-containing protein [Tyzzerella sp.]|nr:helix-turn-helix domain-containing protein [Tyzzerella sp.]